MKVFRSLKEIFPQVDVRILKAVALEHSTDVDAAVEFVLYEVMPALNEPADVLVMPSYNAVPTLDKSAYVKPDWLHDWPPEKENSVADVRELDINQEPEEDNANLLSESSIASECHGELTHAASGNKGNNSNTEDNGLRHLASFDVASSSPSELTTTACEIIIPHDTTGYFDVKSNLFNDTTICASSNAYVNNQSIPTIKPLSITSSASINRKLVSNGNPDEPVMSMQHISRTLETLGGKDYAGSDGSVQEVRGAEATAQNSQQGLNFIIESGGSASKDLSRSHDVNDFSNSGIYNSRSSSVTSLLDMPSSVSEDASNLKHGVFEDKVNDSLLHQFEEQCSMGICEDSLKSLALETEATYVAAKPTLVGSQSSCGEAMDILESFLSDVKSNKESFVLSFESIKNMAKEVNLHEDRAREAKEAASKAGNDILTKAEDMKQMLIHAKETKEMQAAEVYGEKSILATEARELQSCLLNISDQREKSLSIIEEIQRTLEMRMAAANEELAAAEKEKLEKEAAARELLKEQEVIMEELVQESERLQREGEENSKLREFLMDRGQVVDALQGEIAVICEDVMLLKERIDGRLPVSRFLQMTGSSLVTSSSTSSNLGSSSERIVHAAESGGSKETRDELQNNGKGSVKEMDSADLSNSDDDDGWHLFGMS